MESTVGERKDPKPICDATTQNFWHSMACFRARFARRSVGELGRDQLPGLSGGRWPTAYCRHGQALTADGGAGWRKAGTCIWPSK